MAAFSHFELQKSLYAALTADAALSAMITGVFDKVPEGTAYPYVTLGNMTIRQNSTKTTHSLAIQATLSVFSRAAGRKEAAAIMDRIHTLLHQASLSVTGHTLILLRFAESSITLEADGMTYRGTLRFNAITEAN